MQKRRNPLHFTPALASPPPPFQKRGPETKSSLGDSPGIPLDIRTVRERRKAVRGGCRGARAVPKAGNVTFAARRVRPRHN